MVFFGKVLKTYCLLTLFLVSKSIGFSTIHLPTQLSTSGLKTSTVLEIFGNALKDAFANDDALGKRKNEGLSGGPDYNENVSVNGKKVQGAVVGQKLTVVAGRARVKIPVNCQKGDCGKLNDTHIFLSGNHFVRGVSKQCNPLIFLSFAV